MADDGHERRDDDDDEEEEVDDSNYKTQKDAVLFAIDISSSMLTKQEPKDERKDDRDSPATAALKCATQLMQQRIISNPKDMMGILLFGTEKSKFQEDSEGSGGLSYPHCYLLSDLNVPSAHDIKRLRDLVESEEEAQDILKPADEPVAMGNVLFCANQIFTTKAPNFSSRRLFIVTDEDDPHADDRQARSSAAVRAKDLYDLGVIIELFPISPPGGEFDRTKFYDDIVYRPAMADPDAPALTSQAAKGAKAGEGISLLESLLSNITSKATPKRAQFSIPMEIGPGLRIGIKGYVMISRQKPVRSVYVWMGGDKPQLATINSAQIAEDTARTVDKAEIRKAYKFGGETISFTPEELSKIKNFGDPIIRIIGFKPIDRLPIWANIRAPYFIYPAEEDFVGSTRVFSALQQKLIKSQKMGIAWFVPRRNASPYLSAIIPSEVQYNGDGDQVRPPGLWVLPLPYNDDIREKPETEMVQATDVLTNKMRIVVQQLQLPQGKYEPHKFPNPALQFFYSILQSVALAEDVPESKDVVDKTKPRYKPIHKRTGPYIIEYGEELETEYKNYMQSNRHKNQSLPSHPASKKRSGSTDEQPIKKQKTTDSEGPGITDEEMRAAYMKNNVKKFKIPELKEWLKSKGESGSGKKDELVNRVEEIWEQKMEVD